MRISTRVVIDLETGKVIARDSYEYSGPLALAIKAATKAASGAASTAAQTGNQYGNAAAGIGGTLIPAAHSRSAASDRNQSDRFEFDARSGAARSGWF